MDVQQLHELILTGEIDKAKQVFEVNKDVTLIRKAIAQYETADHDVHDKIIRKDKTLENGRQADVTRLSVPLQKKIVLLAAAFLGSPELECTPNNDTEQSLLDAITEVWDDNKLDYRFKKIAKRVMSELECAELWYMQNKGEETKLRMRLLHYSYDPVTRTGGDMLYPVFDVYGDMIAFGRGYKVFEEGKEVEYFDIYTAETLYFLRKSETQWEFIDVPLMTVIDETGNEITKQGNVGIPNPTGKIPIIYYNQAITEWNDVQEMIDRLEKKISNHADTNDRFDSPIMFTEGEVDGFDLQKDDTGKLLEGKNGAKVSYITWDNAPESMKMEIDNLLTFIHEFTHTPRLTFETVAGKGIQFSGVALQMLFMDAHMKASDKEDMFGECVQRRINYIKAALGVINKDLNGIELQIKPKFTYFLPKNIPEMVDTLVTAVTGKIISTETAIKLNPLVSDPESEAQLVGDEAKAMQGALGLDALQNSLQP